MYYDEKLINKIKDILINRGETIAAAESVTAGHVQAAISLATDAAQFYQGGITCYNLGQKTRHLDIEPILGMKTDCIAPKIAADMATAVSRLFISDFGIGITGYASIVPECEKEGLFAFFSITYKRALVMAKKIKSSKEKPFDVQVDYTMQLLQHLYEYLLERGKSK